MKVKIGVFGSAISDSAEVIAKARKLGEILAAAKVILITGACSGLPYEAALTAHQKNRAEIWGFSPASDYQGQVASVPDNDNSIYSRIIYTPADFTFIGDLRITRKYRNVLSTATCDGGILISGRWGSLNEFTNLYDMGKVIGVLTGTGGVADMLPKLNQQISKPSQARVFFNNSPRTLVKQILNEIQARRTK